jgi:peroxiredoxin
MSHGPSVGDTIAPFEAPDQQGRIQTLDSIRGPDGAVIVFIRSADW